MTICGNMSVPSLMFDNYSKWKTKTASIRSHTTVRGMKVKFPFSSPRPTKTQALLFIKRPWSWRTMGQIVLAYFAPIMTHIWPSGGLSSKCSLQGLSFLSRSSCISRIAITVNGRNDTSVKWSIHLVLNPAASFIVVHVSDFLQVILKVGKFFSEFLPIQKYNHYPRSIPGNLYFVDGISWSGIPVYKHDHPSEKIGELALLALLTTTIRIVI